MPYYLTTPIYYVNDVPHIGTSYTTVAADVLARYHRLRGEEVLFATGTDENATKVVEAAARHGMEPRAFVDQMAASFQRAWSELNVEYDVFIRTSEERHHRAVQHLFRTLQERGDIYAGPYEGWYCVNCETFFAGEETIGTAAEDAGGERRCPNIPEHPPLRLVKEENYFFALSRYGDRLLEHIEANPHFLQPEFRRNEVIAFIKQGLRDVCITRSVGANKAPWGIPVPGDPSQVVYVWFDALINYITVAGYPDDAEALAKWWPADLHLVGKDIYVRFHCTLWPAMLMAAGMEPPRRVFGHGFWMSEGKKMSKSLGNFIEPLQLAARLAEVSGAAPAIAVDAMRYFLFREMPFGEDGNFARQALLQRFNSDLANDLGNALNRSLSMTWQNFEGKVPQVPGSAEPGEAEAKLRSLAVDTHIRIGTALDETRLQDALTCAWEYVSAINKYLGDRHPWVLARDGHREELATVLYHALEAVRAVTTWITPYMPCASAEMRRQLGLAETGAWEDGGQWGVLLPGTQLSEAAPIFPRIDRKILQEALKKMEENQQPTEAPTSSEGATSSTMPPPPAAAVGAEPGSDEVTAPITIDDFVKVELRVAEVLTAERVPKADKLLHLRVSLGDEERTVLAGMAEYYQPEELVGRKVIMVANLAPRKLRGLVSQGMLLAAEADGKVSLLQPDQDLPAGARIR